MLALGAPSVAHAVSAASTVVVSNVGAQTVSATTFYSSTQLAVSWSAATGTVDHYVVTATESVQNSSVSVNASASATSASLAGLKAATTYVVTVKTCADSACSSSASAATSTGTTSAEYWQLQGTGNSYATLTKANTDGSSLSWVMRWGAQAGADYSGRFQYYYKASAGFSTGRSGIGIGTTSGASYDLPTLTSFAPVTTAGLRNPCTSPDSSTDCATTGVYFIDAIQTVPLTSGKVRAYFEAMDALATGKPVRIYSLDSYDGYVGQDFNSSSSQAYCSGTGSADYAPGGACAFTTVIGNNTDTTATSPLKMARQFKIGWDWMADWRWDEAVGTFMIVTGQDACGQTSNGLFFGSWDGSKWTVKTDSAGCAKPMALKAHGPVIVPLGGTAYKLYYEDETNGPESGKPLSLIYADGKNTGSTSNVEIEDWEASSAARQVHFFWPDGTILDAQDEAGLGDHMVLIGKNLSEQNMFVNIGGFDNSKWQKPSSGLGIATLLNPFVASTLTVSTSGAGTVTASPSGITCGSDCTEDYPTGSVITLTANPDSGQMLSAWGGACSASGSSSTCSVTMDAAKTVSATFATLVCSYTLDTSTLTLTTAAAAVGTINLTTLAGCDWTATSNASWITITSGASGSASGSIGYSIAANTSATARTGSITIGDKTFSVSQVGISIPGVPTGVSASAGVAQASVSFTAPTDIGGSVITGYTVSASPSGISASGSSSPISVTGLSAGVAYTFTVTATNAAGISSASSASNSITPSASSGTPVCKLTPSVSSITAGSKLTLSASCTPAATSYVWTNTGFASTAASGIMLPFFSATYSIIGSNAAGAGALVSANVTVSDSAVLSGKRSDYTISATSTGFTVTDNVGSGGTVTYTTGQIKRIRFADTAVAFDFTGISGQAYRLYQAAFDRVPDLGGLGYQMAAMEVSALTLYQVSQNFINSPEFSSKYGALNDTQFVTQLYANVLRRTPDAGGLQFYLDGFNSGAFTRAKVLAGFSESSENQDLVKPAISNGIQYTPDTDAALPTAVSLATPSAATKSSMTLTWSQSASADFASYKLYQASKTGVSSASTLVTTVTNIASLSTKVSGLTANTSYYFVLDVCDTDGHCNASNEVNGPTLP